MECLKTSPEFLNHHDDQGMTALHWAADRGHLDLIKLLLLSVEIDVGIQVTFSD